MLKMYSMMSGRRAGMMWHVAAKETQLRLHVALYILFESKGLLPLVIDYPISAPAVTINAQTGTGTEKTTSRTPFDV